MTPPPAHVFWIFGLSGAGKSTLAALLATDLRAHGVPVLALDGDVMRAGLCKGLGFSDADRAENLRRSAEVARIALNSNLCVVAAFITPLAAHRQLVAATIGAERVSFVWIDAPLATCQARDVKGLYAGATAGRVMQMTGMASGFEVPFGAALTLETGGQTVNTSAGILREYAFGRLSLA